MVAGFPSRNARASGTSPGGDEVSIWPTEGGALHTGLVLIGWFYILCRAGMFIIKTIFKQWDKCREKSRRQQAVEEFYDAFSLESMEPGSTIRIATKGDLVIMMYRKEEAK
ncbi:DUF4752 family protein (plasmid) [Escherichia fergusonii]|nr:DUF4752 family protein [Escherichia fergusonii]